MAVSSGARLGPYEIVAPLGAGGMGEVYRARDTRLDRTVAIKVLAPHLAAAPQFRERFDREARAIAALNHPHICALYDVGDEQGCTFLVMEHLAGETLAHRLTKGPLPLAQTLDIAAQIADALDAAHKHGIVHRDLKPGNVMLTKTGAKLLDFGLARVGAGGVSGLSSLPTEAPLTGAGTILGTLRYMAPEQLEGKAADARSDIFALGAVLYEMATGKKAFEGASQANLIAAILDHHPPPIASSHPLTPPALDHVVQMCLAKDPDDRWQSASDVTRELKWITESGASSTTIPSGVADAAPQRRHRWTTTALFSASVIGAMLATLVVVRVTRWGSPEVPKVSRVLIDVAPAEELRAASPTEVWG